MILLITALFAANMTAAQKPDYLQSRLEKSRIPADAINTTCTHVHLDGDGQRITRQEPAQWFALDDEGSIKILYKDLDGQQLKVHKEGIKWPIDFVRTCLSPAKREYYKTLTGNTTKYLQPQGTATEIYLTQAIVDTYNAATKIKTLYLIEGEFKAYKAWLHSINTDLVHDNLTPFGLPIMAIPGIHNFKNLDKDHLHETIHKYCNQCRPDNIVLILDADLYQLPAFDPEKDETKDLSKRLNNFYTAARDFREMAKNIVPDVYLAHIKEEYLEETYADDEPVKGLDDLLAARHTRELPIIKEILELSRSGANLTYFATHNISAMQPRKLLSLFELELVKGCPRSFYGRHNRILANHVFTFKNGRYQYNTQDGELQLVAHGDSFDFARIGPKYVKIIQFPTATGDTIKKIIPWSPAEIRRDYVDKGIKNFFDTIPKYNAFCNIPEHNPKKYKQRVKDCYNLYFPLTHEPVAGKWDNIENYLRHVFAEQYEIALDWLYLTYTKPMQKIPAICLVSKEKNTGKSTFINLVRAMFEQNTATIGNQELTDRFNEDYITKLVVCIEEGLVEKSLIIEKMKAWITNPTATMDIKNLNRQQVDLFARFIMTSNHPDSFIRIDEDENRFWVRYVKMFTGKEDPDLVSKMTDEIPAFLFYLQHTHKIKYPKYSRLWFDPKVYHNEYLAALQQESHSQLYKNIQLFIEDEFYKYNSPNTIANQKPINTLYYTITEIGEGVYGSHRDTKTNNQYLRRVLTKEFNLPEPGGTAKVARPIETEGHTPEDPEYKLSTKCNVGRWYQFNIEQFIKPETLLQLNIDLVELDKQRKIEQQTLEVQQQASSLPF